MDFFSKAHLLLKVHMIDIHADLKFPLPIFCKRFPFHNLRICRVFSALKKPWQFLTVTIDGGWLSLFANLRSGPACTGSEGGY